MNASYAIDYESIFLHAPVGMCISENRVIQSCNDALAAMFGYPRHELVGQSFRTLYPTQAEFLRTGERIIPIMNAKGRYSDERIMRRANRELFWCHVSGRSLVANEALGAGIWTFDDVSANRPVTAELTPREREIAALLVSMPRSAIRCSSRTFSSIEGSVTDGHWRPSRRVSSLRSKRAAGQA